MNANEPIRSSRGVVIGGAIVAALGGLLFGFDMAVISGANEALQKVFDLDSFWRGFTVAEAMIGTIVGSFGRELAVVDLVACAAPNTRDS